MTQFQFELATLADDAELQEAIARISMPGSVAFRFHRNPSFFQASSLEGSFCQIILCRHRGSGRIVGFGSRSVRTRYLHGEKIPIGYLGSLRIDPAFRRRGLLARGFAFLKSLDADQRARGYLTTIAEGNSMAEQLLLSGRAGLPIYSRIATLETLSVPSNRIRKPLQAKLELRPMEQTDLPEVVKFLQQEGKGKELCPDYQLSDWSTTSTFRGLPLSDGFVALENGKIVGTVGLWDQQSIKQIEIDRYSLSMRWAIPLLNLWSRLRGDPVFPREGQFLDYRIVSFWFAKDGRHDLAQSLLAYAVKKNCRSPIRLLIGFDSRNPLLSWIRPMAQFSYRTGVYSVFWDPSHSMEIGDKEFYLELGCL